MKRVIITAINGYQKFISPYSISSCKFSPTCSEYAKGAIEKFGFFKGILMAIWRILKCNPFSRGGYDPVVQEKDAK